ncbi:MAG: hypothetical protein EXQ87_05565 [Alphaproteobacteria bacterium]|nr:hypothetical protein [Alphaproteobacteria bacterium]
MSNAYAKPLPKIDLLNRPFWEHAKAGRLAVQRCTGCGHRHMPPSPVCPTCLGENQDWEVVSGRGRLVSWVTFHRAYWGGFGADVPYDVCMVELDEGPILVSNLVGAGQDKAAVGAAVSVLFEPVTPEITLPKFRLVE